MTDVEPRTEQQSSPSGLRRGSLGVIGVVYFVLATVSPMGGTVSGLPLNIGLGSGPGTPGTFIVAAAVMVLFVLAYVAISRHVVSAGGFYVYIGEAFGPRAGRAAGYIAFFSYNIFQVALWGVFGFFTHDILVSNFDINISWIVIALIGIGAVGILGYYSVNVSANVLGISMTAEVLIILAMDVGILVAGGDNGLPATSFNPDTVANTGNFGVGLMFCFLLFIGIEATVIYAEEARRPRRTIPLAGVTAVLVIAAFYIFTSYSLVVAYGPDAVASSALSNPGGFVFDAARRYIGGPIVGFMEVLFIISVFADNLGFHNAINRYAYALARDGWMPTPIARTHHRHDSPFVASFVQTAIAAVVVLGFYAGGLDPFTQMFLWLLSLGGLGLMLLITATALGAIVFFRRYKLRRSPWVTMVAPAIATIGLTVQMVLLLTNWDVQVNSTKGVLPYLPALLLVPMAIGWLWPRTRRPRGWKVEVSQW